MAQTYYNANGQVEHTRTTGLADTLYVYDPLGSQVRAGLDVDGNGKLEPIGNDRISESETLYVPLSGDVWQQTQQRVYADPNVQQPVVTSTTLTRLTGLGSGVVSEQVSIDLQGNRARSTVAVNRTTATETRTTDVPDSSYDAVSVTINGKLMTSANTSGTTTSYDYDALGRRRQGVAAQADDAGWGGWQTGHRVYPPYRRAAQPALW
ncbi:MAG TPA: hypothetical protein VF331_21935 [Polyangiales bacterium]